VLVRFGVHVLGTSRLSHLRWRHSGYGVEMQNVLVIFRMCWRDAECVGTIFRYVY